jgi:hypothetical protein
MMVCGSPKVNQVYLEEEEEDEEKKEKETTGIEKWNE